MIEPVVSEHKVVAITYSIVDQTGVILEQSDIPVYYVHSGPNDMFPDVEAALEGCSPGDSVEVVLPPEKPAQKIRSDQIYHPDFYQV